MSDVNLSGFPLHDSPSAAGTAGLDPAQFTAELRGLVLRVLGSRLQAMLNGADNALFELARKNPIKRMPGFLDARHQLRDAMARVRLTENFARALADQFKQQPADASSASDPELALRGNDEVEAAILLTDMAARAGSTYAVPLQELANRLETLARMTPAAPDAACLSPLSFCEAYSEGLKSLGGPAGMRIALSKLFERTVLVDLKPLYAEALALCDRHGLQAGSTPLARPAPATAARSQAPAPAPATTLDAATAALLQRVLEGRAPRLGGDRHSGFLPGFAPSFTDADLAAELIRAATGTAVPDIGAQQLSAMTQRAGLVGRMFNDILADPQVPRALSGVVEAFRFPAIKAALADPAFFSDARHPVRSLVNDMASMASATRINGADSVTRLESWARRVLHQAELDAQGVRDKARTSEPLPPAQVKCFLTEQSRQVQERRDTLLQKVRQAVDQELELNTIAHHVPESIQPLLRSGWGPMMASHLLRHGPESQPYRSGMELLHRVLFALNPDSPNARTPAERAQLRRDLLASLTGVGMAPDRVQDLLKGLDLTLDTFEARDPPGIGAAQAEPAVAAAAPTPAAVPATATASESIAEPAIADTAADAAVAAGLVHEEPVAEATAVVVATPEPEPVAVTTAAIEIAAPVEVAMPIAEAAVADPETEPVAEASAQAPRIDEVVVAAAIAVTAPAPEAMAATTSAAIGIAVLPAAAAAPEPAAETAAEPVAAAPAPATVICLPLELPRPQRFLEQLLRIGAWFRIYDRQTQGTRWLKLNSWFPQVQRASFAEFDGHNMLTVTARDLLEDLLQGRSEPIDIPPQAVMILQALRQQHAEQGAAGEPSVSLVA